MVINMTKWNRNKDASNWWYVAGLTGGIGGLIAIIYVLLSESKMKVFSLLYLLNVLGPIVVYFVVRDEDHKLADLSKKLLIGNLLIAIIVLAAIIAGFTFFFPWTHMITHTGPWCWTNSTGSKICY